LATGKEALNVSRWEKVRHVGGHRVYDVPPSILLVKDSTITIGCRSWKRADTTFRDLIRVQVYVPLGALSGLNKYAIVSYDGMTEVWPNIS
jgi:hypothetical protein